MFSDSRGVGTAVQIEQALAVKARALHKSNQPQLALATYNQVLDPGTEVNWSSSRIKEGERRFFSSWNGVFKVHNSEILFRNR